MNTPKKEVRSAINATDEEWYVFETEAEYHYKSNSTIFIPNTKWSELNSLQLEEILDKLGDQCRAKNLNWGNMDAVSRWKMYQLHKTAATTNKNKSIKHITNGSAKNIGDISGSAESSKMYDPVKEAAKDLKPYQ